MDKKTLTLEGARRVLAAAIAEATKLNAGGAIAVVDDGGNVLALERLDGTFVASANISIGKARTAALFQRPTKVFEDVIKGGRTSMVALQDFTPLQGGIPLTVDGHVVGAVGVSGAASAQQDEEIAMVAAKALQAPMAASMKAPAQVVYMESARVAAAFAKGAALLEVDGYKVHASHREAPGVAEIHTCDTDVIYVLDGTATFVTGGTATENKTTAPEEIRGKDIQGGETRKLVKGDLVIVPPGVPHWFKEIPGPFNYYVVKVRAREGACL